MRMEREMKMVTRHVVFLWRVVPGSEEGGGSIDEDNGCTVSSPDREYRSQAAMAIADRCSGGIRSTREG